VEKLLKTITMTVAVVTVVTVAFVAVTFAYAAQVKTVALPAPQTEKGRPLMQVLKDRKSIREFSAVDLPLQVLSDLLWAACGVNRPDSGKRTAPSAIDMQEIDVYVAKSEGLYLYDAKQHALAPVLPKDIRAVTGQQPFVKEAPVNLIYVADLSKMSSMPGPNRDFYAAVDTGYISENVYLYCSSEGLATVVRGWFDKDALHKAMQLRDTQRVILTQTVGYPKK